MAHFSPKWQTEKYLAGQGLPYIALRAGAFLDRSRDIVADKVGKGVFPDIAPGVALDMIYSVDLARYAAEAAIDLPASAFNQSVDVCCDQAATGPMLAAAFTRALGRPVVAKAVLPRPFMAVLPYIAWLFPSVLQGQVAALRWIRRGGYVSRQREKQQAIFGALPTIEDSVARYCRDKGLCR